MVWRAGYSYSVHHAGAEARDFELIGVDSSKSTAVAGKSRLSNRRKFDQPDGGFEIDKNELDRDRWEEGFVGA